MATDTNKILIGTGILNFPGSTAASRNAAEDVLLKDHQIHHCYFRSAGLHNHLSHHILAAYDLGASPSLIEAIYEEEAKMQRPIMLENDADVLKPGSITKTNWKEHLGNQKAYAAYVSFFIDEVRKTDVNNVVEQYIFAADANDNDVGMLRRLMSGVLHPFIQLGYAAEFGADNHLVAEALAQTAIHGNDPAIKTCFEYPTPPPQGSSELLNVFQILREIQNSSVLAPVMPYKPELLFSARRDEAFVTPSKRGSELARLVSLWKISADSLDKAIEESIWAATLLLAATGRAGKKPRLDFFLMHGLTSSIFLPSLIKIIPNPVHQVSLFRHWLSALGTVIIARGRAHVDANLIMHYPDTPLPPAFANTMPHAHSTAIGPSVPSLNPWTLITQSALRADDSHVTKSIRALLYGAKLYGHVALGGLVAKDEEEYLKGLKNVDGTLFVRVAGVLMNTLGWLDWGQEPGQWDRSALGWDDAWKDE